MPLFTAALKKAQVVLEGKKRVALILGGLFFAVLLHFSGWAGNLVSFLSGFGYASALFVGFFFSSGFTTPSALLVLAELAASLNPWAICIIGAFGATAGDYLIYRFFKANATPVEKIFKSVRARLAKSKESALYKATPIIAMAILASPLPDEIAMALYGVQKYEEKGFLLFTYASKLAGLAAVSLAAGASF